MVLREKPGPYRATPDVRALEDAPPPFMTESQRNYDTVSRGGRNEDNEGKPVGKKFFSSYLQPCFC
jgi:hypothetical protein